MTDPAESYDLSAVRKLLLTAFNAQELREIFYFAERSELRPVRHEFADGEGLPAMVYKAVSYCERHDLLGELLAAAKEKNPRQYTIVEAETGGFHTQPGAGESATPEPQLDPEAVARYLDAVRARCSRADPRPYRQLSEQRGAPPRLSLLGEEGRGGVYVPLRYDLHLSRPILEPGPGDGLLPEDQDLRRQMARDLSRTDRGPDRGVVHARPRGLYRGRGLRQEHPAAPGGYHPGCPRRGPGPRRVGHRGRGRCPACARVCRPARFRARLPDPAENLPPRRGRPAALPGRPLSALAPRAACPPGFLGDLVRGGRAWLLLDALDEVADFDHRIAVRQVIERLADAFPGNRLLVTARVAAYVRSQHPPGRALPRRPPCAT